MEYEKIKKVDILYLLAVIFAPMVICAICFWLFYQFFSEGGNMAVILTMVPSILSIVWWIFGATLIYKNAHKKLIAELDQMGFKRNHTFYGSSNMVVIDVENGKIALLFLWNPFHSFIVPATRVSRAWVDDGKSGAGFMAGSSRVSFLFDVDGVKIRVNTFTSNQRWRMDSNYILTGISKADMMVKILEEARNKVEQ